MTFAVHASGAARVAIDETVPSLVHDLIASRVTSGRLFTWEGLLASVAYVVLIRGLSRLQPFAA